MRWSVELKLWILVLHCEVRMCWNTHCEVLRMFGAKAVFLEKDCNHTEGMGFHLGVEDRQVNVCTSDEYV